MPKVITYHKLSTIFVNCFKTTFLFVPKVEPFNKFASGSTRKRLGADSATLVKNKIYRRIFISAGSKLFPISPRKLSHKVSSLYCSPFSRINNVKPSHHRQNLVLMSSCIAAGVGPGRRVGGDGPGRCALRRLCHTRLQRRKDTPLIIL